MKASLSSLTAAVRRAERPDQRACTSHKLAADARPEQQRVTARAARRLLVAGLLAAALAVPTARAQAPGAQPGAGTVPSAAGPTAPVRGDLGQLVDQLPAPMASDGQGAAELWQADLLKTLPQPPAQPQSLFDAPASLGAPPPDLEKYFEVDPLLEPPQWGQQPGWFSDTHLDIIHPQLFIGGLSHGVTYPSGATSHVAPGSGNQNWTVAPRIEIGYRLPSGFGGFAFSDRFFSSTGTGNFTGPIGVADRTSRLGANYSDWDYLSREYTPWSTPSALWTLEWRAGIRLAESWIDSQASQPFSRAAMGTGVFAQSVSNYSLGAGPHIGVEIDRKILASGLSFVGRIDIANAFSRERQLYSAYSTTLTPAGRPERGVYTTNFWQQLPILNYQVGLGWQPPQLPGLKVFVGYIYEFWWQVGSNTNLVPAAGGPRAFFDNQGVTLQAGFNW